MCLLLKYFYYVIIHMQRRFMALGTLHAFWIKVLKNLINIHIHFNIFFRTEFIDCLGRTRKCLKSDLNMYMEKDKQLMRIMNKDQLPDEPMGEAEVKLIIRQIFNWCRIIARITRKPIAFRTTWTLNTVIQNSTYKLVLWCSSLSYKCNRCINNPILKSAT